MPVQARTIWIEGFKGLNDSVVPGISPVLTPQLSNVKINHGRVIGRGGMTKYLGIDTDAGAQIIGLFNFRRASGTHTLVRMLPTAMERLSGTWGDITGTALSGTSSTRPQFDIIDDILVFTNEGLDRPRKWTGAGNTANIGGTPPFCKGLKAWIGFLFLFNVSDNGTFTDIFDGHRMGKYSDDWDNDWSICDGNEVVLDETPGAWVASEILGRNMIAFKTDGLVQLRFVEGQTRFHQERVPIDVGCIAPLTIAKIGEAGICFLGTDGMLYIITQEGIKPVSFDALFNTLPPHLDENRFKFARSLVDEDDHIYYLLYNSGSEDINDEHLDSWASYNFRTGEFSKGTLGNVSSAGVLSKIVTSASGFRPADDDEQALVVGTTDDTAGQLVHEFDAGTDDDGVAITREWITNWQNLGEEGWLHGARLIFKKNATAKVRVSVARNLGESFRFEQVFSLAGGKPVDDVVELNYRFPPQWTNWANIRVRMLHRTAASYTELQRIGLEVQSKLPTRESIEDDK